MLVKVISIALIYFPYFSFGFPADEVTHLPGLAKQATFKHYSGYLNATKGRYHHYWFVESQSNPQNDPVVLWLNGGPGCSSLLGLWTENGPFRVQSDGKTVIADPNSWNRIANVLYMESPVGVGFSYSDENNFTLNDDSTAEDNYLALQSFYKKFPHLSKNAFYMTGESYAGFYIPMLALKIFENNKTGIPINLKGIAIGNGVRDFNEYSIENSGKLYEYSHGLIDTSEWREAEKKYCHCSNSSKVAFCERRQARPSDNSFRDLMAQSALFENLQINPYNIYDDCPQIDFNATDKRFSNSRLYTDLNTYFGISFGAMKQLDQFYEYKPECLSDGYIRYMREPSVRKALHIPEHVQKWYMCENSHNYSSQFKSMKAQFKQLIQKYRIEKFFVYTGDLDFFCDIFVSQQMVDDIAGELKLKLKQKWQKWTASGRTAGFVKQYEGISFRTVRGAGHMVPADQPEAGLQIVKELISV